MMTSNAAFKKKIRELATREGIPYAEARTRLLGRHTRSHADVVGFDPQRSHQLKEFQQLIGTVLVEHALELDSADLDYDEAQRRWVEDREREGLRVVSGGQTGPYNDGGTTPWAVHDWRTDELLAEGVSTYDDMAWDLNWIDIGRFEYTGDFGPNAALKAIAADTPPELYRFIEHLTEAIEVDWSNEFVEWIKTHG